MSAIKGRVGAIELELLDAPQGATGKARVSINGAAAREVAWRRDSGGIWIELDGVLRGFSISGQASDDGAPRFEVIQRGGGGEWAGLAFERGAKLAEAAAGSAKRKGVRVRAQMPGKIVRILAREGADVEKDQPLLVMEAMKMENEIRAAQAGKVSRIQVAQGQAVESGAELLTIE